MARAITQRDSYRARAREACIQARYARAGWRSRTGTAYVPRYVPRDTVTWWKSRLRRGSARVKISTETPPPKSLEEEPGNEMTYDILDDVIAHNQWMM